MPAPSGNNNRGRRSMARNNINNSNNSNNGSNSNNGQSSSQQQSSNNSNSIHNNSNSVHLASGSYSSIHHGVGGSKGGSLMPSPPPLSLSLITSAAGDPLVFSETNLDWAKLNIFRTRLCDRLTQTQSCHMANRCLFSHDIFWPRRTPFLPRSTSVTLRYIPVWCPRLPWPPLVGYCDSMGKISWTSSDPKWEDSRCHQRCTRGDNCPFAHNVEELLFHPEVYKTRSCCLASDENFDALFNSGCVALCPWYFCPFAHDLYELRDLRAARQAWHLPPQIVDDQFVARTQDFDELELQIIDFVRRSHNGSLGLYASRDSPLSPIWWRRMPPVIRPHAGCSLEKLIPSSDHRHLRFDDLLYVMVVTSFINLLLYPVENFYVPTLLSLQCAVVQAQCSIEGEHDCATILEKQMQKLDDQYGGISGSITNNNNSNNLGNSCNSLSTSECNNPALSRRTSASSGSAYRCLVPAVTSPVSAVAGGMCNKQQPLQREQPTRRVFPVNDGNGIVGRGSLTNLTGGNSTGVNGLPSRATNSVGTNARRPRRITGGTNNTNSVSRDSTSGVGGRQVSGGKAGNSVLFQLSDPRLNGRSGSIPISLNGGASSFLPFADTGGYPFDLSADMSLNAGAKATTSDPLGTTDAAVIAAAATCGGTTGHSHHQSQVTNSSSQSTIETSSGAPLIEDLSKYYVAAAGMVQQHQADLSAAEASLMYLASSTPAASVSGVDRSSSLHDEIGGSPHNDNVNGYMLMDENSSASSQLLSKSAANLRMSPVNFFDNSTSRIAQAATAATTSPPNIAQQQQQDQQHDPQTAAAAACTDPFSPLSYYLPAAPLYAENEADLSNGEKNHTPRNNFSLLGNASSSAPVLQRFSTYTPTSTPLTANSKNATAQYLIDALGTEPDELSMLLEFITSPAGVQAAVDWRLKQVQTGNPSNNNAIGLTGISGIEADHERNTCTNFKQTSAAEYNHSCVMANNSNNNNNLGTTMTTAANSSPGSTTAAVSEHSQAGQSHSQQQQADIDENNHHHHHQEETVELQRFSD